MLNIEMQNKNEYNIKERSEVYASGIVYNSLRIRDKKQRGAMACVSNL